MFDGKFDKYVSENQKLFSNHKRKSLCVLYVRIVYTTPKRMLSLSSSPLTVSVIHTTKAHI